MSKGKIAETIRDFGMGDSVENITKYESNYISTTKYTLYNFLPLSLLGQFKRYANIYFLVMAILQCIPAISPLNPISSIAPLVFVISVCKCVCVVTVCLLVSVTQHYQRVFVCVSLCLHSYIHTHTDTLPS